MGSDRVAWGRNPRPLVIAHRGASADAVENTLEAFRLARQQRADGVELDVLRCGSGEVVVFHDDDLERLANRPYLIRELSYSVLQKVDLGGGARVPLLDEVLRDLADDGGMLLNIELKTCPEWRGRARDDGLAAAVAKSIEAHGCQERALVSSFDPILLARFRARSPKIATGLLFAHDQSLPLRRAWSAPLLRPTALHPESLLVDAQAIQKWQRRGYAVHVWTVDDAAEIRALAALGVDAIITNRPSFARDVLTS